MPATKSPAKRVLNLCFWPLPQESGTHLRGGKLAANINVSDLGTATGLSCCTDGGPSGKLVSACSLGQPTERAPPGSSEEGRVPGGNATAPQPRPTTQATPSTVPTWASKCPFSQSPERRRDRGRQGGSGRLRERDSTSATLLLFKKVHFFSFYVKLTPAL